MVEVTASYLIPTRIKRKRKIPSLSIGLSKHKKSIENYIMMNIIARRKICGNYHMLFAVTGKLPPEFCHPEFCINDQSSLLMFYISYANNSLCTYPGVKELQKRLFVRCCMCSEIIGRATMQQCWREG